MTLGVFLTLPDPGVGTRILAGCTTGAMAVSIAQPTDVVKVRFQAQLNLQGVDRRYSGALKAYGKIFREEGLRGLWKGGWVSGFDGHYSHLCRLTVKTLTTPSQTASH